MAQKSSYNQFTDNINSFNSVNVSTTNNNQTLNFNNGIDEEKRQILEWLSPLEPRNRHHDVRNDRVDGVGDWLLETSEFREWQAGQDGSSKGVLFCYGNPGVGKTHLTSLVIDYLCDKYGGKDIVVAGLYCDFLAQQEQSTTNMLGAILKQLVSGGEIPEHIKTAFQKAKNELGGRCPGLPKLIELLKSTLALLPRAFICIDALDELLPRHRLDLLISLRDILRESPDTRIFVTARLHIQDEIKRFLTQAVQIPITPAKGDIKTYLEMRLDRDTEPNAMDDDLRADILRLIPETICEILLLVSLNMDAILEEVTIHERRKKLLGMTKGNGLGDAYSATLARIKAQKGSKARLGSEVLMWVSHAKRPLKANELCDALGVEAGSTDLNRKNIPVIQTLLGCSLGLVTVEASSSTVRLIHFTLQEYLCHDPSLFPSAHLMMAEVCLTYLNFESIRNLPLAPHYPHPALEETNFVQYASCYWGIHARTEINDNMKALALRLLDVYDKHISSQILFCHATQNSLLFYEGSGGLIEGFTGLHALAYFGLGELAVAVLELKEWDLNATDSEGMAAIARASLNRHGEVVKMLLKQNDVNPNIVDLGDRTPLWMAATNGDARVVQILLERNDVNPNARGEWGETPLSTAAMWGHPEVVKMLLERDDIDPNTQDEKGRTPLSRASGEGHLDIVDMLLERDDVDPNTQDEEGLTPLSWASREGHPEAVEMLLERNDINPNTRDKWGETPLSKAAELGHREVVKILLERNDVNPNTRHGRGGTPLSKAAKLGHPEVVEMLLERNDVNPNTRDKWGGTPLSKAAEFGHPEVVKMLLERNDVDPNTQDEKGQTPLFWASGEGHPEVVKLLLKRNEVNPNTVDKKGRTPILWAAMKGHEEAVKILLKQNDVNPDMMDLWDQTPLRMASMKGNSGVVKILLERNDVNPNTRDKWGQTPLSKATQLENPEVVKILLKQNDVNPNTRDKWGRTPLSKAAKLGHSEVVKMLLERNDVDPDTRDKWGETPLSKATKLGHPEVVKILLERNDVDPDTQDGCGQTPLMYAAQDGNQDFVKMLLTRNDVNLNRVDKEGQTPLLRAVERGHAGVVEILLGRNDVNPGMKDEDGRTPLSRAAQRGNTAILKMLLERNDVHPDTLDQSGRTPLLWAAWHGDVEIVDLLLARDVNPDTKDRYGRTPFTLATNNGHKGVVEMLLKRKRPAPKPSEGKESTEPSSTETPGLLRPPSKRIRLLWYHRPNLSTILHFLLFRIIPHIPDSQSVSWHISAPPQLFLILLSILFLMLYLYFPFPLITIDSPTSPSDNIQ